MVLAHNVAIGRTLAALTSVLIAPSFAWIGCNPDVDLAGRPCPCATGYFCDETRNLCLPDQGVSDAGGLRSDATSDSGGIGDGGNNTGAIIFHESFDPPQVDWLGAWDDSNTTNASWGRDGTQVYMGTGSMLLSSVNAGTVSLESKDLALDFPDPSNVTDLYLRVHLRVNSFAFGPNSMLALAIFTAASGPFIQFSWPLGYNPSAFAHDGIITTPQYDLGSLSTDTWFCLRIKYSTTDRRVEWQINNNSPIGYSGGLQPLPSVRIRSAFLPDNNVLAEHWVDDLVVADEPIECGTP